MPIQPTTNPTIDQTRLSITHLNSQDGPPIPHKGLFAALTNLWRDDALETALFVGLIAGLAWAPFWLGSNRIFAWGVNAIWFPGLTICFEISLLARGRRHPVGIGNLIVPAGLLVLVLLWIGLQTSTLLTSSGMAHPIWAMTADVLERPLNGTISVNRGATSLALIRLLTDASALWLSIQLCRRSDRAILLLRSIGLIITCYSAYGLMTAAFLSNAIPFFDAPETGGYVRSTFVNHNSFATYAGIGLVVTVAMTLRLYRHEVPGERGLRAFRLNRLIEATGRRGWLLIGSGFVCLVALLGTTSRGGILATVLGIFGLFILSITRQRRRRTEQIEAILLITLALVGGFLFFGDIFVGRIASSGFQDTSRLSTYLITMHSILDSPLLGFGYGTFADVFPMYRDQSISVFNVWDKAHNTYLEVWQGLGLVFGSALMAALGWLFVRCLVGAIKRRRDASPAIVASAVALLVGVHALVDFSLQIEAITLTFMALLGAGVAQSGSSRHAISD